MESSNATKTKSLAIKKSNNKDKDTTITQKFRYEGNKSTDKMSNIEKYQQSRATCTSKAKEEIGK
jgi:hypothetical protein